jgi:hypothetical protein
MQRGNDTLTTLFAGVVAIGVIFLIVITLASLIFGE